VSVISFKERLFSAKIVILKSNDGTIFSMPLYVINLKYFADKF